MTEASELAALAGRLGVALRAVLDEDSDSPKVVHDGHLDRLIDEVEMAIPALLQAAAAIERLGNEAERAWTERNTAYAKAKAWEGVVYVENLPLRAVRMDEWGPGEGGTTSVPEITPRKLTDLLDEIQALRRSQIGRRR